MSVMSSLRRLNLSLKIFSFGFLLVLLSGCATTQQECPTNPDAPYSYDAIYLHTKNLLSKKLSDKGEAYVWSGKIRYALYGMDESSLVKEKINLHVRQLEKYTGLDIAAAKTIREANIYLFFSDNPDEVGRSAAFSSILRVGLGYSQDEIDLEREKISNVKSINSYYGYSDGDIAMFSQISRTAKKLGVSADFLFLSSIYAALVIHNKENVVSPSVSNSGVGKSEKGRLSKYDSLLLREIYSGRVVGSEEYIKDLSCRIYKGY